MGDTWIVSLEYFLDESGAIIQFKGPARKLAEHLVAIVAMATKPEISPAQEYQVRCRRRPGRKPCSGIIEAAFDPEDEKIIWRCPICEDNGSISNWKGSMWDLSDSDVFH
jgi:hypothetical protein